MFQATFVLATTSIYYIILLYSIITLGLKVKSLHAYNTFSTYNWHIAYYTNSPRTEIIYYHKLHIYVENKEGFGITKESPFT